MSSGLGLPLIAVVSPDGVVSLISGSFCTARWALWWQTRCNSTLLTQLEQHFCRLPASLLECRSHGSVARKQYRKALRLTSWRSATRLGLNLTFIRFNSRSWECWSRWVHGVSVRLAYLTNAACGAAPVGRTRQSNQHYTDWPVSSFGYAGKLFWDRRCSYYTNVP